MRQGLSKSLTLHVLVLLLVIFGLPHFGEDEIMTMSPIPVEIVSPDQVASAPQRAHKPPPAPPKPAPPKPAPPPPSEPPEPTPPPPPPVPSPDAVPPPPSEKPPPPKPQQQTEVKPPPTPRPRPPQPKPPQQQPKPQQRQEDNKQFANLLNDLSSENTTDDDKPPREGADDSPVEDSPNISSLLNGSEMDAVRQQVMGCWLEPTGLKEGENYMVEIQVVVNQDRTVQSAKVVDSPRMRSDPFYRTLGESAVRALYNPRCSPLLLPEGKYNTWRKITFRFSPGGVI